MVFVLQSLFNFVSVVLGQKKILCWAGQDLQESNLAWDVMGNDIVISSFSNKGWTKPNEWGR